MTILAVMMFSWVVIIVFWTWFYIASKNTTIHQPTSQCNHGVSVIIAYKNAADHIEKTIHQILNQDYQNFEIIAINDFSDDSGHQTLQKIVDERLVLLHAKNDLPGKKSALTIAISYAKNDLLLFTDADCRPVSKYWIQSMASKMSSDPANEIVLGYGPTTIQTGWLNKFERYETILTAMQYFTYAIFRIPYMGVGRNMMYRKSLFKSVNGFLSHEVIPSGDDDLFIANGAKGHNTAINLEKDSFIYSEGKPSLSNFLHQKSRHASTSFHYKKLHQFMLGAFAITQIAFYLTLIFAVFSGEITFVFGIFLLAFKWCLQMVLQKRFFNILDGTNIFLLFPILDICMFTYYITLPFYAMVRPKGW